MPIETDTMEEKAMKEMERKPYSSESLRVRCPSCRKLYLVQFGDVKEAKPRFECIQCHSRFWLSLPDMDLSAEMIGIPIQVREAPAKPKRDTPITDPAAAIETKPCPKCFKPVAIGAAECTHCGVLISKMKDLDFKESGPAHSETLGAAWKKVLANYADEAVHVDFLRIAQRERNLPYAAAQYNQMKKLMPTDEVAQKRLKEVQALGTTLVPNLENKERRRTYPRIWQVPLMAAAMMIFVGMILPVFRNMVGVGAAFLFIALAMQIQMRRR